jgi:predicted nuclease of restriction endonuclease-like (RecB) superfamily
MKREGLVYPLSYFSPYTGLKEIGRGMTDCIIASAKDVLGANTEFHFLKEQVLTVCLMSVLAALRDSYVLEFLDIPEIHKERELRKTLIASLCDFILESGRDFTLVGEEYRVRVGNRDFRIDLVLFHRGLPCLVVIELKVTEFEPFF